MRYLLLLLTILPIQQEKWLTEHTEAISKAQVENKPLLLLFLGSGWCPWSDQLCQKILSKKEFTDILSRDFVLVKVNCPETGSHPLKERYGVQQCPFFLIVDPSGEKIAEVNYLNLNSGAYASHIQSLLSDYKLLQKTTAKAHLEKLSLEELKSLYGKARGLANDGFKKAIVQAGMKVDSGVDFLLEDYMAHLENGNDVSELKNQICARDPHNLLGAQLKLALLEYQRLSKQNKDTNAHHPLLDFVKKFEKSDKLWEVEMTISQYLFGQNQLDEALKHARASLEAAPIESKSEVAQAIEYLENELETH